MQDGLANVLDQRCGQVVRSHLDTPKQENLGAEIVARPFYDVAPNSRTLSLAMLTYVRSVSIPA